MPKRKNVRGLFVDADGNIVDPRSEGRRCVYSPETFRCKLYPPRGKRKSSAGLRVFRTQPVKVYNNRKPSRKTSRKTSRKNSRKLSRENAETLRRVMEALAQQMPGPSGLNNARKNRKAGTLVNAAGIPRNPLALPWY